MKYAPARLQWFSLAAVAICVTTTPNPFAAAAPHGDFRPAPAPHASASERQSRGNTAENNILRYRLRTMGPWDDWPAQAFDPIEGHSNFAAHQESLFGKYSAIRSS